MNAKRKILTISGSTKKGSSNEQILNFISKKYESDFEFQFFSDLENLPYFNPDLYGDLEPHSVKNFKKLIAQSDAVIISTPEYVFSLPGVLKNAIEWVVSSTVFTNKPLGIIVGAASGTQALSSLDLIMSTLQCRIAPEAKVLIQGVKGKLSEDGDLTDPIALKEIAQMIASL